MIEKDKSNTIELFDVFSKKEVRKKISEIITSHEYDHDFIVSIPHSGTLVPKEILSELEDVDLLIEIDMLSDTIFSFKRGIEICSRLAPFVVDMNRAKQGSSQAPSHLRNDPLNYITIDDKSLRRCPLTKKRSLELMGYYDLYHALIRQAIETMRLSRGFALVIDGHSMTSIGLRYSVDKDKKRGDFVIGTLRGTSAHPTIIKAFKDELCSHAEQLNMRVDVDVPYDGGFITRTHSAYADVLQIEVSMDAYMHEGFIKDKARRYRLKSRHTKVKNALLSAIEKAAEAGRRLNDSSSI